MKAILHIVRKEFLQLRRDPAMLRVIFIAPIVQLIILGYAANMDIATIATVVCDMDRSQTSREFLTQFGNSNLFTLDRSVDRLKDIDHVLDNGEAAMAIVIPRGFGDHILSGRQTQIQLIADGTDTIAATTGLNSASFIVARYAQNIALQTFARARPLGLTPVQIDPRVRVWYNPDLKSRNFMIPGVLGLLLMVVTTVLTAMAVVKEKEIGTLEQLIVTPIRPYQLILGKFAPFILIGFLEAVFAITVASLWFDIPVRGSVPLLFGLCGIYLLTTLGLGLLVSTISRTQQQAMMTAAFFFMLPMIILSGFVFPIENMPRLIQMVTYLLPPRYFFVIIRGIFLKGTGVVHLWDEALILLVFGMVILTLSILRFQKKLA